jgi:CheY-like chemotaxis protein
MRKILIVDDEPHILENLANELTAEQCAVYTSPSIEKAQEIILKYELNYAIIDLKLLDFTSSFGGIEVFKFLKQKQPKVKSIILSAFHLDDVEKQLKRQSSSPDEIEGILSEIKVDYIYKGDQKNYIDAVLEKLREVSPINWYGDYHALLIAVQKYQDSRLNLNYPITDAKRLKKVLINNYSFDENHIELLPDPSRDEILDQLFNLSKKLSSKDNLLIFYAGHGSWNDARKQGYWLPHNAHSDIPTNWVSNSDIRDSISGIDTQHTLLISDACFSGAIFKLRHTSSFPDIIQEKYNKRSRRAITSSDETRPVPDRSIFLECLLKSLTENQKSYLYAEKLYVDICESFNVTVAQPGLKSSLAARKSNS